MREILRGFTLSIPNVADGRDMALEIEELLPPMIKDIREPFFGGGMPGPINVPLGIELSEARFKLASWNKNILKLIGKAPGQYDRLTFRGAAVSEVSGDTTAILIVLEGRVAEPTPDPWNRSNRSGLDYVVDSIRYYKHVVGNDPIHEVDFLNHKLLVAGIDQRAQVNAALGF